MLEMNRVSSPSFSFGWFWCEVVAVSLFRVFCRSPPVYVIKYWLISNNTKEIIKKDSPRAQTTCLVLLGLFSLFWVFQPSSFRLYRRSNLYLQSLVSNSTKEEKRKLTWAQTTSGVSFGPAFIHAAFSFVVIKRWWRWWPLLSWMLKLLLLLLVVVLLESMSWQSHGHRCDIVVIRCYYCWWCR